MATIVSAATGNFSAGATWVGGVVPTAGDVAQVAATHVVTIDVNTTCDAVESLNTSGYFVLPDGVTLTAEVRGGATAANNYVLQYNGTTSATIAGNVTLTQNTASVFVVRHTGSAGTLNITGNITKTVTPATAGAISLANNAKISITGAINWNTGTGSGVNCDGISGGTGVIITVNGAITAGATSGADAILFTSGTCSVTGNVNGGSYAGGDTDNPDGVQTTTGDVVVVGNVYGGTNNAAGLGNHGVFVSGNGSVTVTGTVYGGTNANHGIDCSGTTTITGDVYGGTGTAVGLLGLGTASSANNFGRHQITGDLFASADAPAMEFGAGTLFTLNGDATDDATGRPAFAGIGRIRIANPTTHVHSRRTGAYTYIVATLQNGTEIQLVSNDANGLAEADVRDGVSYASGTKTGTLAVPPTSAVSVGVPVDNTVGTGITTAADVATLVGAQIAAAVTAP
jgi:hypothetical protein